MNPRKRTRKLPADEVKRFEDLAIIKYDEKKPLALRTEAAAELVRWTYGKPPELIGDALASIGKDEEKPIEVRIAAACALLQLVQEKPPEFVCTVFRGLRNRRVCAKCGKQIDHEAHSGDYPGLYCGACCPGCSLIPRERLKEVPLTADDAAAHGFAQTEDFAREIVFIVYGDHWNTSTGVN